MTKEEFFTVYAQHLNENQKEAVQAVYGQVLMLAVPGSGKTTVLVNRLGYMLFCEGICPEEILTLTYTVAATADMERRFSSLFGETYSGRLEFRTINGICAKIIQLYGQKIGREAFALMTDEKEIGRILTKILEKYLSEYPTESDVKNVRTLITYCKNMLFSEEEIEKRGEQEQLKLLPIFREYNKYLRENGLMDYDDQMIYAYRLLKGSPWLLQYYREKYRYICVDEAQDTSKIQHIIIGLLAGEKGNLFMVGDEDQSIYGFRAAYPEALLHFEKKYPEARVLIMNQNYRSNAKIVAAADRFIQNNKARHEKHMVAVRAGEKEIDYIELKNRSGQYAYLVKVAENCSRETAVLYRDNECVLPLVDLLERKKIPYRIKSMDMGFFTHRIVTDVVNIMQFAFDPYNTDLFLRIYFKCQTYLKKNQAEEMCRVSVERDIPVLDAADYVDGISGMVIGKCRALSTHLRNMRKEAPGKALFRIETPLGYGEYLERNNLDTNKLFLLKMLAGEEETVKGFLSRLSYLQNRLKTNRQGTEGVILSTIHSSKGLEYDRVYLMDVCDGVFPDREISSKMNPADKQKLEEERRLFYVGITRAKNELHIFKMSFQPSRFIRELQPEGAGKSGKKASVKQKAVGAAEGKSGEISGLQAGMRVVQRKYGGGAVSGLEYDTAGNLCKFMVTFDSGEEKSFAFPMAFSGGMRLEEKH